MRAMYFQWQPIRVVAAFSLLLCFSAEPIRAAVENGTGTPPPQAANPQNTQINPKDATPETRRQHQETLRALPFAESRDFDDARRGFIGAPDTPSIVNNAGRPVFSLAPYEFLREETAPPTVNPSLWRHARLNLEGGLFKVTDGIYQVRTLDVSNMTIIEGDSGLILIDPLQSRETAAAALALYRRLVPNATEAERPIRAIIYTHSHLDHFGGVKGVINEEYVQAGKVTVIAPNGFLEAAVSENLLAGNATVRRSMYSYGPRLPKGARGQVDAGIGKVVSTGEQTLIAPTDTIQQDGEKRTLDGVEIEFLLAPETEAPVEMLMYFPRFKAICAAEDANHTLHNLYTLRGALVRDAMRWQQALDEAIDRYGHRAEVIFAQHHWPRWGQKDIVRYLEQQRNAYKYLHDQTLRLANKGMPPDEIAETLRLPASLEREWHLRGYYGTVNHNVKAVYQRYLGWYSGHPADLHPLPPVEAGKRYVAFMGGADQVIAKARASYAKGEYRWVAEVLKHVVFADPTHEEARLLQADALEQLGYQAESAVWRNAYLMAAVELRSGLGAPPASTGAASQSLATALTPEMILAYMAVHINGAKAEGKNIRLNWRLPASRTAKQAEADHETYAIRLEDSVLLYKKNRPFANPDATLTLAPLALFAIVAGHSSLEAALSAGHVAMTGNAARARELFDLLEPPSLLFPIVTPSQ